MILLTHLSSFIFRSSYLEVNGMGLSVLSAHLSYRIDLTFFFLLTVHHWCAGLLLEIESAIFFAPHSLVPLCRSTNLFDVHVEWFVSNTRFNQNHRKWYAHHMAARRSIWSIPLISVYERGHIAIYAQCWQYLLPVNEKFLDDKKNCFKAKYGKNCTYIPQKD